MLKSPAPSRLRRNAGMTIVCILVLVVAGSVYAASAPAPGVATFRNAASAYQLNLEVELGTNDGPSRHTEHMTLALCMASGKTGTVVTDRGWRIEATPSSEGDNRLRVKMAVTAAGKLVAKNLLDAKLGEPAHAVGKGADGTHDYAIEVTPVAGCPVRTQRPGTDSRMQL